MPGAFIFLFIFLGMYNLRVNKLNGGTECLVVYLLVFAHFLLFSRSIIISHSSMYQMLRDGRS